MARAVLALFGLTFTAAAACYSERLPPPTYRYACSADRDCAGAERCIDDLCQVPCTQATFEEDCGDPFVACIHGVCASTCTVGEGACPEPQTCFDLSALGVDPETVADAGGGGRGGFGAVPDGALGVCGTECEEDSCPEGEICAMGLCVVTCDPADPNCPRGLACLEGLCLPEDLAEDAELEGDAE